MATRVSPGTTESIEDYAASVLHKLTYIKGQIETYGMEIFSVVGGLFNSPTPSF